MDAVIPRLLTSEVVKAIYLDKSFPYSYLPSSHVVECIHFKIIGWEVFRYSSFCGCGYSIYYADNNIFKQVVVFAPCKD